MIIGLVGRARVGKDTAASFLTDKYTIRRLAQPVKDACKVLYGWSDVHIEGPDKEHIDRQWGISPRMAMLHLTHTMRQCNGSDFFTRRFFNQWDGQEPVVVPDVRYAHDVEEIHRRGGITIKIKRNGGPDYDVEFPIDSISTMYEVENNGSIEDLRLKVLACVDSGLASLSKPAEKGLH
jgi:hypothetical protein